MIIGECQNFFSIKKIRLNFFGSLINTIFFFLFPKSDLASKIVQQPKFLRPFKNEGDKVHIAGCRIISYFNLTNSDIYWLKDGIQKSCQKLVVSISNTQWKTYSSYGQVIRIKAFINALFFQKAT